MFIATPPASFIRDTSPRRPKLPITLLGAAFFLGLVSFMPDMVIGAPSSAPGLLGDLGEPLAQLAAARLPELAVEAEDYQPLPRRSAEMNALLGKAVEILTHGEALSSRTRLLALEADLRATEARIASERRQLAAGTPSCASGTASLEAMVKTIACTLAPARAASPETISDLEGTLAQRRAQIAAERDRFTADLQQIGLDVTPLQVEGLLHMAGAEDLLDLKTAYANLSDFTETVRQAALKADQTPATMRRYYGLYTVLLEVALHMHEELYFKLRQDYLPQVDAIATDSIATYRQAERLRSGITNAAYVPVLDQNMRSLAATLRAAQLYRTALTAQARAVDSAWQALRERHQVAVNAWRAISLSGELLAQMQDSGKAIDNLSKVVPPSLERLNTPALQREFDRLTSAIITPNS